MTNKKPHQQNLDRSLPSLDTPMSSRRRRLLPNMQIAPDLFGRVSEAFARFMGTPAFLVGMTIFCAVWLGWNTFLPESMQFDPRALNYTLLTLILSLQASYAAPLLLLAQNRQDDRDRVQSEQDRRNAERNHATTDYITREIAALRLAMGDMATRDFVRGELRDIAETYDKADADLRDELITQISAQITKNLQADIAAAVTAALEEKS